LASCDNPQRFADKIKILEAKMELLEEGKNTLIEAENAPPVLPDLVEESMKAGKENQEKIFDQMRDEIQDEMRNLPKINGDPSDAAVEKAAKEYEEYRNLPGLGGTPSIAEREAMEALPGLGDTPSIAEHNAMVEEFRQVREGDILSVPELLPETSNDFELPLPETEGMIPPLELQGDNEVPESEVPLPELGDQSDIDKINGYEQELAIELAKLKATCDNYVKKEAPAAISKTCPDACTKYKKCAGFTDGATATDQQDAYDGCMEECAKWADSTKICINKKPISVAADCMNLSVCAMAEYSGMLK